MNLKALKKKVAPLFRKKHVIKSILFGSFSRGTESKNSDLDLLIIKNTKNRFLDRFNEFDELYSLLRNYTFDLLVYTPEELARNAHRPFIKRILSEGVIFYEH